MFLFLILIGCMNNESEDFRGVVLDIKESSITVTIPKDERDPDASYPEYEYIINNTTEFKGGKYEDIIEGDTLKIWAKEDSEEKIIAKTVLLIEHK